MGNSGLGFNARIHIIGQHAQPAHCYVDAFAFGFAFVSQFACYRPQPCGRCCRLQIWIDWRAFHAFLPCSICNKWLSGRGLTPSLCPAFCGLALPARLRRHALRPWRGGNGYAFARHHAALCRGAMRLGRCRPLSVRAASCALAPLPPCKRRQALCGAHFANHIGRRAGQAANADVR